MRTLAAVQSNLANSKQLTWKCQASDPVQLRRAQQQADVWPLNSTMTSTLWACRSSVMLRGVLLPGRNTSNCLGTCRDAQQSQVRLASQFSQQNTRLRCRIACI